MRCLPDFPGPAVAELHFSMLNVSSAAWQPPPEALLPFPSPDNALPRNTTVSSGLFSTELSGGPDGNIGRMSSSGT